VSVNSHYGQSTLSHCLYLLTVLLTKCNYFCFEVFKNRSTVNSYTYALFIAPPKSKRCHTCKVGWFIFLSVNVNLITQNAVGIVCEMFWEGRPVGRGTVD